jgi:hypothetical protein
MTLTNEWPIARDAEGGGNDDQGAGSDGAAGDFADAFHVTNEWDPSAALLGATLLSAAAGSYAALLLITNDPVLTPMRVASLVMMAMVLGGTWGRMIWNMH